MPLKKLPPNIVSRLRRIVKREGKKDPGLDRVYRSLGKMKNIDHRDPVDSFECFPNDTTRAGQRVRQMNVSRNSPGVELVVKHVHGKSLSDAKVTADFTIKFVNDFVSRHNSLFKPKKYVIARPNAYAIGKYLVAMSKTDCPSIDEVIGEHSRTRRGEEFLKNVLNGKKKELEIAAAEFRKNRLGKAHTNMLVIGMRGKKFIFMPLIDYF